MGPLTGTTKVSKSVPIGSHSWNRASLQGPGVEELFEFDRSDRILGRSGVGSGGGRGWFGVVGGGQDLLAIRKRVTHLA